MLHTLICTVGGAKETTYANVRNRSLPGSPSTNKPDNFRWQCCHEQDGGGGKLVSRCQLLCLSRWFSFAHARILYQRGLIRIKCLKAFQTPGDVDNFWLDLQTKQTIMMQACVKMYTAVEQQMPALHVFINVFSSAVRQPRRIRARGRLLRRLTQRCAEKGRQQKNPSTKTVKEESCAASVRVLRAQISLGRPERIVSVRDAIKKIQVFLQSCRKGVFSGTLQ